LNDNTVRCWGQYARGNLGNSGGPAAVQVQNMNDAVAVAAMSGGGRAGPRCALRMNGQVACWGDPRRGQLGNGSDFRGEIQNPATVSLPTMATAVAGFMNGGCALLQDKTVQCWGRMDFGQAGNGSTGQQNVPVQVSDINDATAIAAGGRGVCAIVTGGSVKCWGDYGVGSSNTPQVLKNF
jgi:alpha-tubulin suppressor-like RCC1 family protein